MITIIFSSLLICFIFVCAIFSRAKLLLKKKHYQEKLIEKTDKQLDTVEQLVHDLEFSQVEMQVRTYFSFIKFMDN